MPKPSSPLDSAIHKAYWRLLPLLFISYIVAYVDRNNVSLAKLKMINDLPSFRHRTEIIFGLGQAAFFIGYLFLEIPGTILVEKWSARKWICRIMITWGVLASLTAIVTQPWHFYLIRFLLGLAEAGFFPGIVVYLTHWFPTKARARALSLFLTAIPVARLFSYYLYRKTLFAQFVSPKISYYFLRMGTMENNVYHPTLFRLRGWQWMYIFWGVPSILLGIVVLFFLTDRPNEAKWLTEQQCQALESELTIEQTRRQDIKGHSTSLIKGLFNIKVLLLAAVYFFVGSANYGVDFFLPTILRDWYHPSDALLTWVLMIPPLAATISMLLAGWSSDRLKERRFHTAMPILLGAIGLGLTLIRSQPMTAMICLFAIISIGTKACKPAFWSLPNLFLSKTAAAGSVGFINSIGNLGSGAGPTIMGFLKDETGSFFFAILYLSIIMGLAAVVVIFLPFHDESRRHQKQIPVDTHEELLATSTTQT